MEKREVYRGMAEIVSVEPYAFDKDTEFIWGKSHVQALGTMSERQRNDAMMFVFTVKAETGEQRSIKIRCYAKELAGRDLEFYKSEDGSVPTLFDKAVAQLFRYKLIREKSIEHLTDVCEMVGEKRPVSFIDLLSDTNGEWIPFAQFESNVAKRLTGEDLAKRISAMTGKTIPAPKVTATASAPAASAVPSAPADDDDLPF